MVLESTYRWLNIGGSMMNYKFLAGLMALALIVSTGAEARGGRGGGGGRAYGGYASPPSYAQPMGRGGKRAMQSFDESCPSCPQQNYGTTYSQPYYGGQISGSCQPGSSCYQGSTYPGSSTIYQGQIIQGGNCAGGVCRPGASTAYPVNNGQSGQAPAPAARSYQQPAPVYQSAPTAPAPAPSFFEGSDARPALKFPSKGIVASTVSYLKWESKQAEKYDALMDAQSESVALVEFYTTPCDHCEHTKALLKDKLAPKYGGKVAFYHVQIQPEHDLQIPGTLRDRKEIRDLADDGGYPALMLMKKIGNRWEVVDRWNGRFTETQFAEKLAQTEVR